MSLVAQGHDPVAERSASRGEERETVADMAAAFVKKYAKRQQKSWRETERVLLRDVNPAIGSKRLDEVTRQDVVRLLDQIAERGPVMANRTLAYIRRFFNWCIERGYTTQNPCAGLQPFGVNGSRDRTLSDSELSDLWHAAERVSAIWTPMVKLLLLTAQRRSEVAEMRWPEVDFEDRMWTIPAERAKNKRAHAVPLTETAIELLSSISRYSYLGEGGFVVESPFVFTTTGSTPVSGFSKTKKTLDNEILARRCAVASDAQPMPGWTFHDLRRTVTTGMARLGIHPHIADALLNHKDGIIRGVAAIYNQHGYLDERRRALEAWEQHLLRAVGAPPYDG